jgi:hypothetical protein
MESTSLFCGDDLLRATAAGLRAAPLQLAGRCWLPLQVARWVGALTALARIARSATALRGAIPYLQQQREVGGVNA